MNCFDCDKIFKLNEGENCEKCEDCRLTAHKTYCEHSECHTRASFGFENKYARFCKKHKLPNMENVKSKKCEFDGCKTCPNFNYEGEIKALYCATHKLVGPPLYYKLGSSSQAGSDTTC